MLHSPILPQRKWHSNEKPQHSHIVNEAVSLPAAYSYHHSAKGSLRTTFLCITVGRIHVLYLEQRAVSSCSTLD